MTDLQTLFQTVDELSPDEIKQLYLHIVETRMAFIAAPEEPLSKLRVLDLFENIGETWMSDDFDAELPDAFWLGADQV